MLGTKGGTWLPIVDLDVPAGTWVLQAKAVAIGYAANDYVRCAIWNGGVYYDSSAANIAPTSTGIPLPLLAQVTFTTTTHIELRCSHDGDRDPAPWLDPLTILTASPS